MKLVIVLLVLGVAGFGYFLWKKSKKTTAVDTNVAKPTSETKTVAKKDDAPVKEVKTKEPKAKSTKKQ